jgi:hypothetical protein
MSGAPTLPTVLHHVQNERQRGSSLFARHSNETTRMIRKKRTRSRAT